MPGPQQTIYTMEASNLICGRGGDGQQPGISTHLQQQELKLPGLETNFTDYRAGGAALAIDIATHMNRLEASFNLAGWNPDIMKMIALSSKEVQHFTAYGLIRDQRTGRPMQSVATMWGQMARVNPQAFRKGDLQGHEYAIRGITHYVLQMQRSPTEALEEIFYIDFFESAFRVEGNEIYAEENNILGIVGAGV